MKDVRDMREMLRAMQSGELTVSRGMELLDLWLAGNYSDDMLPPVREGLGEDEMPWDRIDALTKQRDELIAALEAIAKAARDQGPHTGASFSQIADIADAAIAKAQP